MTQSGFSKVEKFQCNVCRTVYDDSESASKCANSHVEITNIAQFNFKKTWQGKSFPSKLLILFGEDKNPLEFRLVEF